MYFRQKECDTRCKARKNGKKKKKIKKKKDGQMQKVIDHIKEQ